MSATGDRDQEIPREPMTAEEIEAANVKPVVKLGGQVTLVEHDPRWPEFYAEAARRVGDVLRGVAHRVEHVGSTSVPGLPAKPVIDMLLVVPDSADERRYVPLLEGIGFELVIREPAWYEHRVLREHHVGAAAEHVNLHVLSEGCPEVHRMLLFRDWLRGNRADRELYAETKRSLARQTWEYTQNYADAKSETVAGILKRAGHAG